jgi:hypothetical protein
MYKEPDFDEIYFERTGNVKKLIEEAIPLTYLGLHLVRIAEMFSYNSMPTTVLTTDNWKLPATTTLVLR